MKTRFRTCGTIVLVFLMTSLFTSSCQRCYKCTGEITSVTINPFTGEIMEDAIPDEQEFCGPGNYGTKESREAFEDLGYECERTD